MNDPGFRRNDRLHAKLDAQLAAGQPLLLTHDEIDEWRAQFTLAIPVSHLAYKGVPIGETPGIDIAAQLYWHCTSCGNHEPAQPDYKHGDSEPCCLCEHGTARVGTLKEAAAVEQRIALGLKP